MSFFDKLTSAAAELTGRARKFAAPITDRGYLDAAIAVGFLIGGADGDFDEDEKQGMLNLIKQDPTLSAFSEDAVTDAYKRINDLFAITLPLGRKKALKVIGSITDQAQKESLMEFAAVISTLDGNVGDDERAMLEKIADETGVSVDEDLLEV